MIIEKKVLLYSGCCGFRGCGSISATGSQCLCDGRSSGRKKIFKATLLSSCSLVTHDCYARKSDNPDVWDLQVEQMNTKHVTTYRTSIYLLCI